eukprot:c27850_g1_i1 orf=499-4035(-)
MISQHSLLTWFCQWCVEEDGWFSPQNRSRAEPEEQFSGLIREQAMASAPVGLETDEASRPELAILFLGFSLVLGMLCRHMLRGTKLPYTVALLVLGIFLGVLEYKTTHGLGSLGESIRLWSRINPSLILFVFLPALLFESSFAMEVHQLKRCLLQMVLLAGPGVVISTFCLGIITHFVLPYMWNWSTSLLLGGLLSATDPVAVVALLKDLGAGKKLSTIIEGESLMNDGTAIVIFRLFLQMVLGQHFNTMEIITFLSRVALGAVAIGVAFGLISVWWLGAIFNDTVIEITLTLTASYIAYYTAEDEANVSGVLAVMTIGMFFAIFARTAFKGESQQSMHYFWEMITYIANTLIFILSGLVIAESILSRHNAFEGRDWAYLLLLYIFVQLSRAVVVIALYPGLQYFGYGLDWKEAIVLSWAGLRGAVALSLSLMVNHTGSDVSYISQKTASRFVFLTGGVVFLTLIINGTTTQFLLDLLHMNKTSTIKLRIMEYTRCEMNSKALEAFGELGEDEDLGPAEWSTIKKYINCLNVMNEDASSAHPHASNDSEIEFHKTQLQDTRLRLLNGVQAAYWRMLEEGRITQTAAMLLMQSVDEALDLVVKHEPLLDWKGLDPHVHFPNYLKYLQLRNWNLLPKKLLTFLIVGRLELACYISAAFLRAHRSARHQLREFIGESEIAEIVIQESESEGAAAKQFLEDVRLSFPQVLRVVKTRQVTYAILIHLSEYVQSLEKAGLLEEKETNHLHDAVQADLKKLLRNPPLVKMPTADETLNNQPFLGALPDEIHKPLANGAKEFMKLRESLLYKDNSKPDGIWLIANGVVKWSNTTSACQHLLHPTFSHGSTLGLYEVLTGKPHLCDLVADSMVHCFFIEASKILAALRSTPHVEGFFWQESALAVTKIVLPKLFEAMTMQELRMIMLEGSTMRIFLWGEVIDFRPGEIGILLEGFLKQEGKEEIITAPAALMSSNTEFYSNNSGSRRVSLSHLGGSFHAETRSRILVIDRAIIHSDHVLPRTSTSFKSHTLLVPPYPSHEFEGLVHWPDTCHSSKQYMGNLAGGSVLSTRMSSKALQLGVFGSKVTGFSKSWKSSVRRLPWLPGMQNKSFPFTSYGRKFMSAGVLPYSQADKGAPICRRLSNPQTMTKGRKQSVDSSDGSDGDDEHIVQINSPSKLFHHPLSLRESC